MSSGGSARDPVLAWLLDPREPAARYLAARELITRRPSDRTLARLRGQVQKRLADGRWNLDWTNGNLVVEPKHKPSKMITFLAFRALRSASCA